ncbi:hypothetical protein [Sphingopyxis sp.]|nr:hypothetical protein [Sphingopyxis sp.]
MTRTTPDTNWIQRFWTTVVEASAAAVAVQYHAPWERPAKR